MLAPKDIQAISKREGLSQAVFAHYLNVTTNCADDSLSPTPRSEITGTDASVPVPHKWVCRRERHALKGLLP